ncbi:hypothetical protein [Methylophilus sp. OH31]|uniref:hypothetical protein n=1 Tax=Methylophilus sp. OH31 TaxID=1387312 RepID=UPI00046575EA|nr:hypothetical protein [Methylophilus sp. OH31]
MRWRKLGQLYSHENHAHEKLISHAANPLAVALNDRIIRVYYSARDSLNRSSVSYVHFDIHTLEVTYVHPEPAFQHGEDNSFYSHGVSIGNIYQAQGKSYMLFMGWQNHASSHWRGDIGRLLVSPDGQLSLDPENAFIGLDAEDNISLSYPWVEKIGSHYQMWYGSTNTWDAGNQEMEHVIKNAYSSDGHHWSKNGIAVPSIIGQAQAFSRPTVLLLNNHYFMWFSYRGGDGRTYRIGRADSIDGMHWELNLKESGIDVSNEGWDSEMIEYPFVFKHGDSIYMLYNGNGYGQTGFGLAVLEDV